MGVLKSFMRTEAGGFQERDLRIPADLSVLREARDWAATAAADFGLADDDAFQVKLATSEAVTNAIVHGSGAQGDTVLLGAYEQEGALVFEVRDSGVEPSRANAPARLADGGRGLELVQMVMDDVQLTRGGEGCVLRFAKRRSEAA